MATQTTTEVTLFQEWQQEQNRHQTETETMRGKYAELIDPVTEAMAVNARGFNEVENKRQNVTKAIGNLILNILPQEGAKISTVIEIVNDLTGADRAYSGTALSSLVFKKEIDLTDDRTVVTAKREVEVI